MDCIDCHNRPTHVFEMPEVAVDGLISTGLISAGIPYIRREAVRVLRELQPGSDTAQNVAARLQAIYQEEHPDAMEVLRKALPAIAERLAAVLERNIFPDMDVTWGSYTDHIGHVDSEGEMTEVGCFRCHDEEHVSKEGAVISQDCETCHAILAWEEEDREALPEFVVDFISRQH
jgi:hypothetical protein